MEGVVSPYQVCACHRLTGRSRVVLSSALKSVSCLLLGCLVRTLGAMVLLSLVLTYLLGWAVLTCAYDGFLCSV